MFWDIVLVGLPLAAFVALAAAFVLVYRRAVDLAADSRATDGVRRGSTEHAGKAAVALVDAAARIDAVRREGAPLSAAVTAVATARITVAAAREAVAALRARPWQEPFRSALTEELAGAEAPIAAAERACGAFAGAPEAADAATGLKRAYLGLLHAREAILDAAGDLAAAENPVGERRRAAR